MTNPNPPSVEEMRNMVRQAADAIRAQAPEPFDTFIVLGSGLGDLANHLTRAVRVPYEHIPHFGTSTVAGHRGQLLIGELFGRRVGLMQGRYHFYEGYAMWQIALPIRAARALGSRRFIVTNAAGGINRSFQVADVMLITDHINLLGMAGHNPLIGPNDDELGPRFPEMTSTYDAELRALALRAARAAGVDLKQGVYAGLAGPSFESPAELRFLRAAGADAVGMSTVNEVLVAQHCGMRVLGLSGITNVVRLSPDEGEPPSHTEVMEAAPKLAPKMLAVVKGVLLGL